MFFKSKKMSLKTKSTSVIAARNRTQKVGRRKLEVNIPKKIINSFAAGLTIGITILILQIVHFNLDYGIGSSAIIYSSVGSSAFILFVMPKSRAAKNSAVIISYVVASIVGYFSYFVSQYSGLAVASTIAVALTGAVMIALRKEHPPSVGLALAFVLFRIDIYGIFLVIALSFIIVGISYALNILIKGTERDI